MTTQAERDALAKAVEFAEYMAKGAEQFIEAVNRYVKAHSDITEESEVEASEEGLSEFGRGLRSDIYEFRKRASRLAAAQAGEQKAAKLTPMDAVYRAMDMASLLAGAVAQNDTAKADACSARLRSHLVEYILNAAYHPAAGEQPVMTPAEAACALAINSAIHRIESGYGLTALEPLRAARDVLKAAGEQAQPVAWLPMESAPKDGTAVRLLINDGEHPLEDENPSASIGSFGVEGGPTEDPTWHFVGWSWHHDCYCRGTGTPIGWLPLHHAPSVQSMSQFLFLQIDDDNKAHVTYCTDRDAVRKAVKEAMFWCEDSDLLPEHNDQINGVMETLLDSGIMNFEGDPPLHLFRLVQPREAGATHA